MRKRGEQNGEQHVQKVSLRERITSGTLPVQYEFTLCKQFYPDSALGLVVQPQGKAKRLTVFTTLNKKTP